MTQIHELPDLTPHESKSSPPDGGSDSDKVTILETGETQDPFKFIPLLLSHRKAICERVSLILWKDDIPASQVSKNLGTCFPRVNKIKGDGNCLFRALCMAVTGWETEHMKIQQLVCDHINEVGPYNSKDSSAGPGYLNESQMRKDAIYGTDVEIFSAAQVLSTDKYVYHKYGSNGLKCLHFSCIHGSGSWKNAIYFDNHTGKGVTGHFDYMTGLK